MFPQNDRLKNLIKQVADDEVAKFLGHNFEDTCFLGVVTAVQVGSIGLGCGSTYLEASPYLPTVDDDGFLDFDKNQHPLKGVHANERIDRVYVTNIPSHLIGLYFTVGDVIDYWHYSGEGADADNIRGSYRTKVYDRSFWAKIDWVCTCGESDSGGGSVESGCAVHGVPNPDTVAWRYKFTAFKHNPTATVLSDKFIPYVCAEGGDPFSGICFNMAEVFNVTGAVTGCGVNVNADGQKTDTDVYDADGTWIGAPDPQYLLPVGPHLNKINPFTDPDKSRCDYTEFYFSPVSNAFGFQATTIDGCCPESSSNTSSSSSCTGDLRCVHRFSTTYDCANGGTWGVISYDGVNCRSLPPTTNEWFIERTDFFTRICRFVFYLTGKCCDHAEAHCEEPGEAQWPDYPTDPLDCCPSSSSATSSGTSSGPHLKCVYRWTTTYNCSDATWGVISFDGQTCTHAPDAVDAWVLDHKNYFTEVCTYAFYRTGDDCDHEEGACPDIDLDALTPDFPDSPFDCDCESVTSSETSSSSVSDGGSGYTGDQTVVTGWDADTCTVTTTVNHYVNGRLTGMD